MDISDLDKKWFDFTEQFVEKLINHNEDWSKMNHKEQELAALWRLEMDVHNGGFLQFFTNWGLECYECAIRCLQKIDAKKTFEIITYSYQVIVIYENDERLVNLTDIYKVLTTEEIDLIDQLDK